MSPLPLQRGAALAMMVIQVVMIDGEPRSKRKRKRKRTLVKAGVRPGLLKEEEAYRRPHPPHQIMGKTGVGLRVTSPHEETEVALLAEKRRKAKLLRETRHRGKSVTAEKKRRLAETRTPPPVNR